MPCHAMLNYKKIETWATTLQTSDSFNHITHRMVHLENRVADIFPIFHIPMNVSETFSMLAFWKEKSTLTSYFLSMNDLNHNSAFNKMNQFLIFCVEKWIRKTFVIRLLNSNLKQCVSFFLFKTQNRFAKICAPPFPIEYKVLFFHLPWNHFTRFIVLAWSGFYLLCIVSKNQKDYAFNLMFVWEHHRQ